jgi:hypothetical protein
MDQLRKAWAWFQRQHFWVLIVVAILIALGFWIRGTGALRTEYAANKSKIEAEFNNIDSQRKKPFHPNQKIIDQQKEEITKEGKGVNEVWQKLYERQRANVLTWPDVLSDRFRKDIEKLKFGKDIPLDMRNNYRDYVGRHFPALPKIVDAAELAAGESGGGRGMGRGGEYAGGRYNSREPGQAGAEPEDDHIVQWLDQQHVRDELDMPTTPTPMKIWVTQEDLWVYETLLGIIAQTNKAAGADRASNAAVREITSLEVGREAALESRTRGRIMMAAVAAAPGGEGMGAGPSEGGGREMGGGGREMGGGGERMGRGGYEGGEGMGGRGGAEDAGASDTALLASRYLDAEEKPVAAPDPTAGVAAFGTEYKRLPVRMELMMDVRWLPHLIAECADAPLQVEVKEVRVNPSASGSGGGYGGRGGGGYGASGSELGDEMSPESEPNMKRVIIQGIIYIFNEPDANALNADTASMVNRLLIDAIAEQRRPLDVRIRG